VTPRDRTVLSVVVALALVAAAWFVLLAPVHEDAKKLDADLAAAQTRVAAAQTTVDGGQRAREAYRFDYATVARLGKAVPADDDVPSLVVQMQGAARRAHVDFRSIVLSTGAGAGAAAPAAAPTATTGPAGVTGATGAAGAVPATQAAASTLPPGAAVGAAGFPTLPFDFTFTGPFFKLQNFLSRLDAFVKVNGANVQVNGRLLTVDGFSLGPSPKGLPTMEASVHATAYLLPADQGLTAGSTPVGPATPATPGAAPAVPTAAATATGVGTR
jgi:hypothetical protein